MDDKQVNIENHIAWQEAAIQELGNLTGRSKPAGPPNRLVCGLADAPGRVRGQGAPRPRTSHRHTTERSGSAVSPSAACCQPVLRIRAEPAR